MADEELAVQLLFQIGDVGAQGLLGDVESIGGFVKLRFSAVMKVVHEKKVHIKPPEYKKKGNCSVGLRTCCADRRKPRLKAKSIGVADLEWIFACNCEGTEQLQKSLIVSVVQSLGSAVLIIKGTGQPE